MKFKTKESVIGKPRDFSFVENDVRVSATLNNNGSNTRGE